MHMGNRARPTGPVHEKTIEIRWRDMDALGHVTNSVYLTYLEEARDEWLEKVFGRPESILDFVIVHASIDFRSELYLEDDVVITRCSLREIGRSSIRVAQEIAKLDGTLAAEAEVVLVARSSDHVDSRALTELERSALERHLGDVGVKS